MRLSTNLALPESIEEIHKNHTKIVNKNRVIYLSIYESYVANFSSNSRGISRVAGYLEKVLEYLPAAPISQRGL